MDWVNWNHFHMDWTYGTLKKTTLKTDTQNTTHTANTNTYTRTEAAVSNE